MRELENYTEEELLKELEKRKTAKKNIQKKNSKDIDWEPLIQLCEENNGHILKNGSSLKDIEHYIFEITMEAIYGKNYWDWQKSLID